MDKYTLSYFKLKRQFQAQGYKEVSTGQLREYVEQFLWRRQKPDTFKQQKEMILSVTPNQLFDYETLKIKKDNSLKWQDIDFGQL